MYLFTYLLDINKILVNTFIGLLLAFEIFIYFFCRKWLYPLLLDQMEILIFYVLVDVFTEKI